MPTTWQIECMHARIRSLESEILRVKEKDHPYSEPDIIYRALLEVLKSRSDHFEDARELFADESERRSLQASFDEVALDIQRIFEVFSYADRLDSPRIPFEILRSLSWAARSLLGEDCKAVVRLDTAYNYTIVSCRRKFAELGWERYWNRSVKEVDNDKDRPSTVLVLGFPSPDASAILLHALAAHEFGHEIHFHYASALDDTRDRGLAKAKKQFNDEIQEYILDNTRRREGVGQGDAYEASSERAEAQLLKISESWLAEIWSDLVAARLVGPASLAALDRILLNSSEPCESHPPLALRRRLVRTYLQERLPQVAKDDVWTRVLWGPQNGDGGGADPPLLRKNDPLKTLYMVSEYVCASSLNDVAKIIEAVDCPLDRPDLQSIVNKMEESLENLAPPNSVYVSRSEKANASSFWLLMYATWHLRLNTVRFDEFCDRHKWMEDRGKAEKVLGNMLLHALQSIELLYQWNLKKGLPPPMIGGADGAQ